MTAQLIAAPVWALCSPDTQFLAGPARLPAVLVVGNSELSGSQIHMLVAEARVNVAHNYFSKSHRIVKRNCSSYQCLGNCMKKSPKCLQRITSLVGVIHPFQGIWNARTTKFGLRGMDHFQPRKLFRLCKAVISSGLAEMVEMPKLTRGMSINFASCPVICFIC
jgi:hypothetical protein